VLTLHAHPVHSSIENRGMYMIVNGHTNRKACFTLALLHPIKNSRRLAFGRRNASHKQNSRQFPTFKNPTKTNSEKFFPHFPI